MGDTPVSAGSKARFFQLYLLSCMRVEPAIVRTALSELGATAEELKAAKSDMQGRGFDMVGGPSAAFFKELLGPPVAETSADQDDLPEVFQGAMVLHFKLPLWPDFEFIVYELPDGGTFGPSFRRPSGTQTPSLSSFMDLKTWKFVKEEIDLHFGPAESVDAWDNWEKIDYMIPKSPGERPEPCSVLFDFNLLQSAK